MPNVNVSLDVRNFASNGSDGYTNTTASNHAVYSYQYGGGSDGHGNVNETTDAGSATITVALNSDPRYQISNVTFSGDIENQLSSPPVGPGATSVVITDSDTSSGSGYFSITVSDTTANCTLSCDPDITNRPKPPSAQARPGARPRA